MFVHDHLPKEMRLFSEWTRQTDYALSAPGEPFYTDEFGRPQAVRRCQDQAQAYNVLHGLQHINHDDYREVDQQRAGRIADAYDALPMDDSTNPLVIESYQALVRETVDQFNHAVRSGMTFEPWKGDGEAYVDDNEGGDYSSQEVFRMVDDVRDNQHMWFYTGGEPNTFMKTIDKGTGLPVNDLFRAIHDYFGHCAMGADFGPQGEENAWVSHMQMFSEPARRALTVETRGQNCWVNFGRQNYDEDGDYLNILPSKRPYAVQKTAVFSGPNDWMNRL